MMSFPLQLEVLSSKDVKSKKRWRKIESNGDDTDNISLLGRRTIAQLNLVTGKKKRVDASIRKLLGRVVYINGSNSGSCVVGMLQDGHLFRWRKNTRTITNIQPCPDFTPNTSTAEEVQGQSSQVFKRPKLFISDDGATILLFSRSHGIYLWRTIGFQNSGWTRITIGPQAAQLLTAKGVTMDVVFHSNQLMGQVCQCAFVSWSGENIAVGILSLRHNLSRPVISYSLNKYPLSDFKPPLMDPGLKDSLIPCWSRNGKILAVVVNQKQVHRTKILLIHSISSSVVTASFSKILRNAMDMSLWITSLSWTNDHLFLACITKQGAVFLVSTNGNIMQVIVRSSVDKFGPGVFLPLEGLLGFRRPIVEGVPKVVDDSTDTSMQSTILPPKLRKPCYMVNAHPTLPILLCGDGYSVAAIKISTSINHRDMAIMSLAETVHRVERVIKNNKLQVAILCPLSYLTPSESEEFDSENEQRWRQIIKSTRQRLFPESALNQAADESMEKSPEQEALLSFLISDLDDSRLARSQSRLESTLKDSVMEEATFSLVADLQNCHVNLLSTLMLLSITRENAQPGSSENRRNASQFTDSELEVIYAMTFKLYCDILLQVQEIGDILPVDSLSASYMLNNVEQPASVRELISEMLTSLSRGVLSLISWRNLSVSASVMAAVIKEMTVTLLLCGKKSSEGCLCGDDIVKNIQNAVGFLSMAEKQAAQQIRSSYEFMYSDPTTSPDLHEGYSFDSEMLFSSSWAALTDFVDRLHVEGSPFHKDSTMLCPILSYLQLKTSRRIVSLVSAHDDDAISATRNLVEMCLLLRDYKFPNTLALAYGILTHLNTNSRKWTDEKWLPVEILASVMASYFKGTTVTVPSIVAALSKTGQSEFFGDHSTILQQETITKSIRSIDDCWNISNTVLLMLACGQIKQAGEVVQDVGDWRTSFTLNAVYEKTSLFHPDRTHSTTESLLKTRFKEIVSSIFGAKVQIPNDPPEIVFESQRESFQVDSIPHAKCLRDFYEISSMVGVDVTTWTVCAFLNNLKSCCSNGVRLIVPETFRLPHPQLYLPQSTLEQGFHDSEIQLRNTVSGYVRTILTILNCIGIQRVVALWYLKYLDKESTCDKSHHDTSLKKKSKKPLSDYALLKDVTVQGLELSIDNLHGADTDDLYFLAAAFRETTAILWLFFIRDQLTSCLRKYQTAREDFSGFDGGENEFSDSRKKDVCATIHECLYWIRKIISFAKFFHFENDLDELILCLVAELPLNTEMATILAEFMHEEKAMSPKNKHRLQVLIEKMRKVQISTNDDGSVSKPLSVIFNEKCRYYHKNSNSGHFYAPKLHLMSRSGTSIVTSQGDTLSREEPSVISKTSPDDILSMLKTCYTFEADEAYHKFVFEFLEIALSKSPATATFTPKKNKKSRPASQPLEYPLVLTYRTEIATLKLEMIKTPDHQDSDATLDIKIPVMKQQVHSSDVETTDDAILDLSQNHVLHWDYFAGKNGHKMAESDSKFTLETRMIPRVNFSTLSPQLQKRLHRLVPYFLWLDHWRAQSVPLPQKSSYTQSKPAMRVDIGTEHLIHGYTMAELRFGKINKKKPPQTKTPDDQITTVSSISESEHIDKVEQKLPADELPSVVMDAESSHVLHSETAPKEIEEVGEAIVAVKTPDHVLSEETEHKVIQLSELHSESKELLAEQDESTLKRSETQEPTANDNTIEQVPEISRSDLIVEDLEPPAPEASSGNLLRKILQKVESQERPTQASDVMSHSGLSVASTGLQSDVMPDGGGRVRRSKMDKKKNKDKQEMQELVRNEIQSAMVGQQVLFLAQIFQSAMMQASGFLAQSMAPVPSQKAPPMPESKPPPSVPLPQKSQNRLQILTLDGAPSYLPESRFSQKPTRAPLKILTENQGIRKSPTKFLHDEKENAPRMYSPEKTKTGTNITPTIYTPEKGPRGFTDPELMNREAGTSTLTPGMLQDFKPSAECPTCHSHPVPKPTVRLPLLAVANAVSAKMENRSVTYANALPRLINLRHILRHEQKRASESGEQSQSVYHMGKALPLLQADKIPGFYRRKPVIKEVPFAMSVPVTQAAAPPSHKAPVQIHKDVTQPEVLEPQVEQPKIPIPSELLPKVLTTEEAEEIRNGVLAHYKTVVDQQKLMWRESGQQTEDVDDEKQDKGVGPSEDHIQPTLPRGIMKQKQDRYEMHQELADRFLDVNKNRVSDLDTTPTKELKSEDVARLQGIQAGMIPAVQNLVKSRWSSAMHEMSSEMDAVNEMDSDIRSRIPSQEHFEMRREGSLSSGPIQTVQETVDQFPTRSDFGSGSDVRRSDGHSAATSVISSPYIPPSDYILGIGNRLLHEPDIASESYPSEHSAKPKSHFSSELMKYKRKIDEAFSLAEFGPGRDPSEHSYAPSGRMTPASSVMKLDGSVVSSLSWDELEAMVTESLLADAEGDRVSTADISNVDSRMQDALHLLNDLQSEQAEFNKRGSKATTAYKQQKPPTKKDKRRDANVDARLQDALSLLNEIKTDHKQIKTGGRTPQKQKTAPQKHSSSTSAGVDNWTMEAMSLLEELKTEYEPEHRSQIKENLPPEALGRTDSNNMRAHIEEAMSLLRDDTSSSPMSYVPSSHVSFQPSSQMPRRYY